MTLSKRLDALTDALIAADGRLDEHLIASAVEVAHRADERSRIGVDLTVVALGGATGSGKSSVFNAISGIDLAGVGIRRPTTTGTLACTWGDYDATRLLTWIGVPDRQRLTRRGALGVPGKRRNDLNGLVLLDMPDHDSLREAHHEEVAHVIERADLFVWVVDPQKYADAAIHEKYLRPRADQQGNTVVVLNQIDRLAESDRDLAIADLRRMLDNDGLKETPLVVTSTATGEGIDGLRDLIAERVVTNTSWSKRLDVDVRAAALALLAETGDVEAPGFSDEDRQQVVDALSVAVGVPQIAQAAQSSIDRRLRLETGWPFLSFLHQLRKDPLATAGLLRTPRDLVANTMPMPPAVQAATADSAVRKVIDSATEGLHPHWRTAVVEAAGLRSVGTQPRRRVIDDLDHAVAEVDLGLADSAAWVTPWRILQWLCAASLVLGLAWTVLVVIGAFSPLPQPPTPTVLGMPLAFGMLLVGVGGGIALTVTSTKYAAAVARRRARLIQSALEDAIEDLLDNSILPPAQAELDRYETYRSRVVTAAH